MAEKKKILYMQENEFRYICDLPDRQFREKS